MWEPGPFSKDALRRVRSLEGNSVCMDCGLPETSWGGPTYGILLCVTCAGRHRSLGTHLTVIKSLTMDRWDPGQIRRMELGGNGQLRAWFAKCQTENSVLEMKYRTKAATLYRDNLRAAAEEELQRERGGEGGGGRDDDAASNKSDLKKGRIFAAAEAAAAADLKLERAQAKAAAKRSKVAARSRRSKKGADAVWDLPATTRISHASPDVVNDSAGHVELDSASGFVEARSCGNGEYEVVFGPGGMGFTLMKDGVSRALVTRLAPGGPAYRLGVRTGDYLVGVNGRRIYDYDQLMLLLPYAARPLRLLFEGAGAALAAVPASGSHATEGERRRGPRRSARTGPQPRAVGSSSENRSDSDSGSSSSKSSSAHSSSSSCSSSGGESGGDEGRGAGGVMAYGAGRTERERKGEVVAVKGKGQVGDGRRSSALTSAKARAVVDGDVTGNGSDAGLGDATPSVPSEAISQEVNRAVSTSAKVEGRGAKGIRSGEGAGKNSASLARTTAATAGTRGVEEPIRSTIGEGGRGNGRNGDTSVGMVNVVGANAKETAGRDVGAGQAPNEVEGAGDRVGCVVEHGNQECATTSAAALRVVRQNAPNGGQEVAARGEGLVNADAADVPTEREKEDAVAAKLAPKQSDVVSVAQERAAEESAAVVRGANNGDSLVDRKDTVVTSAAKVVSTDAEKRRTRRNGGQNKQSKSKRDHHGEVQREDENGRDERASSSKSTSDEARLSSASGQKPQKDKCSMLIVGNKVSVRERKGTKWRKGLLRRRHGDGTWTVRYSRGMEERHVPSERIRSRGTEEGAVAAAAHGISNLNVAGSSGASRTGDDGAELSTTKTERHRPHLSASKKGRKEAPSASTNGHDGGRHNPKNESSRSQAWADDGTCVGRGDDFRAPGELRNDFFDDADADSDSEVSALADYALVDPTCSIGNPATFPYASHPAFTLPVTAPRRRMEGFGGGAGHGLGGAAAGAKGGAKGARSGPYGAASRARELVVSFPAGSMGLTLTKEITGGCSVTKVVPGGVAQTRGVTVGQRVCAVNGQPCGTYEQTMAIIAGSPRPISITFLLGGMQAFGSDGGSHVAGPASPTAALGAPNQTWTDVGMAATVGLMDAANAVAVEWGIGTQTPGVFDQMTGSRGPGSFPLPAQPQGFRVHQKHSLMAVPAGVAGGYGNSLLRHKTFTIDVSEDMATMSTKKVLTDAPGSASGEFDVEFGEGELGMRLEERGSFKMLSVVSRVTEDGQAMSLGVQEGCTVVGINGEEYLSHAHTVATLKHARRPITVRFRAPERRGRR